LMPRTFGTLDKTRKATIRNANERYDILKDMNGIIFARMGRIIDVAHPPSEYVTFVMYDRYWKIEVDFDARLDEEFNVPTTKQRIDVSERIWEILKAEGVFKTIESMRKAVKRDFDQAETARDVKPDQPRPSEEAMKKAAASTPKAPPVVEQKRAERGSERLRKEAEKQAASTGKSVEEVQRHLEAEYATGSYKVEKRAVPGGNFFEVEYFGGTKRLWLNTESRFYKNLYAASGTTPSQRFALEVLLFSIGECVADARDEFKAMYDVEIPNWSRKLEYALAQLEESGDFHQLGHDTIAEEEQRQVAA
jgi:hypothetical protein